MEQVVCIVPHGPSPSTCSGPQACLQKGDLVYISKEALTSAEYDDPVRIEFYDSDERSEINHACMMVPRYCVNRIERVECVLDHRPTSETQIELKKGEVLYMSHQEIQAEYDALVSVRKMSGWGLVPRYCVKQL